MPWQIIVLLAFAFWLIACAVLLAIVDACRTIRHGLEFDWRCDDEPDDLELHLAMRRQSVGR